MKERGKLGGSPLSDGSVTQKIEVELDAFADNPGHLPN